jgi:hypothetical protein
MVHLSQLSSYFSIECTCGTCQVSGFASQIADLTKEMTSTVSVAIRNSGDAQKIVQHFGGMKKCLLTIAHSVASEVVDKHEADVSNLLSQFDVVASILGKSVISAFDSSLAAVLNTVVKGLSPECETPLDTKKITADLMASSETESVPIVMPSFSACIAA